MKIVWKTTKTNLKKTMEDLGIQRMLHGEPFADSSKAVLIWLPLWTDVHFVPGKETPISTPRKQGTLQ